MNHATHCHRLALVVVGALIVIVAAGLAEAGLIEAHQQALAIYEQTKDPVAGIKILEVAGIQALLKRGAHRPADLPDTVYVNLINDYAFFLSETADRYGEAIPILQEVIFFDRARHVAYLNLGDTYAKLRVGTKDPKKRRELREDTRRMYQAYVRLREEKKIPGEMPSRVREALGLGKVQYEMVTNKDARLCPAMLGLVNEDLRRYGYVAYRQHEEFGAITWRPLSEVLGEKAKDHACGIYRMARIDINNDGQLDVVIRMTQCLRGNLTDTLYIFDGSQKPFESVVKTLGDVYDNSHAHVPFSGIGPVYDLRELLRKDGKGPESIMELLSIIPFRHKDQTLITLTEDSGYWFAVSRYRAPKDTEDLCIFRYNQASWDFLNRQEEE